MIALLLALVLAGSEAESYDALLAEGLARGKAGALDEAAALFDRAIALEPARPEARVERGGVWFSQGRYAAAAAELREALRRREDDYARDLLASALHLAGRSDEALATWNPLGRPTLGTISILGLSHTRDRVARRELPFHEGELLSLASVREARLRLAETGAFERVSVRPVPRGGGTADVEVALLERHGLAHGWLDFAVTTGVEALQDRVRLRYANLAGEAVALGLEHRWETHRPQTAASIDWPRPLGLAAVLHVRGFDGRQDYAGDEGLVRQDARGVEIGVRRVLGAATVAQASLRTVDRTVSDPMLPAGRLTGLDVGFERRLVDRRRVRTAVQARAFSAGGSESDFVRGQLRARTEWRLTLPEGEQPSPSVLAAQVVLGQASGETPFDEAFAPGGSPEMELPLRAHRQAEDGILGVTPLGRSLILGNLEWRRSLVRRAGFDAGFVLLYDGACVSQPGRTVFHDVGLGLRIGLPGAGRVRFDYGHGLVDGSDAFFVGLGQTF